MICAEERTALLNEFSHRVQRHFPEQVWRSLFQERTGSAQFGTAMRTVLCVECPESGPLTCEGVVANLSRLARVHGGHVDPSGDRFAFVSFGRPQDALRLAVAAQRLLGRARLRMGIITGRCRLVRGQADGRQILMLLGSERARAAVVAERAAAGTVQISAETYLALDNSFDDELGSCVLMTDYDGDVLREVTLTVPPDRSEDVSTFAGLGLT